MIGALNRRQRLVSAAAKRAGLQTSFQAIALELGLIVFDFSGPRVGWVELQKTADIVLDWQQLGCVPASGGCFDVGIYSICGWRSSRKVNGEADDDETGDGKRDSKRPLLMRCIVGLTGAAQVFIRDGRELTSFLG